MQNAKPCSFCGDGTHVEWHCPELVAPIRDTGMMKPPSGMPMGGGDDDRCPIRQNADAPRQTFIHWATDCIVAGWDIKALKLSPLKMELFIC